MAALSTSNVTRTPLGNGFSFMAGQWTGSLGDAAATYTVQAGKIYMAQFWSNAASAYVEAPVSFAAGTVSGTQILTIESISGVTDGYFGILLRG